MDTVSAAATGAAVATGAPSNGATAPTATTVPKRRGGRVAARDLGLSSPAGAGDAALDDSPTDTDDAAAAATDWVPETPKASAVTAQHTAPAHAATDVSALSASGLVEGFADLAVSGQGVNSHQ